MVGNSCSGKSDPIGGCTLCRKFSYGCEDLPVQTWDSRPNSCRPMAEMGVRGGGLLQKLRENYGKTVRIQWLIIMSPMFPSTYFYTVPPK